MPQFGVGCQLVNVNVVHPQEDVLGLDVRVDNLALCVQVFQTPQNLRTGEQSPPETEHARILQIWRKSHLSDDAFDTREWKTGVVGLNDPPEELVAQHLQDHAHIWGVIKDTVRVHTVVSFLRIGPAR